MLKIYIEHYLHIRIASLQMWSVDYLELQLISSQRGSIPLVKIEALTSGPYDIRTPRLSPQVLPYSCSSQPRAGNPSTYSNSYIFEIIMYLFGAYIHMTSIRVLPALG